MVKRLLRLAYLMRKKNGGGFEMYKKTWEHVCFCFVTLDPFLNFSVPQFFLILKTDLIKMEKKKDLLNRVIKRLKGIIHEKCLVSTWGALNEYEPFYCFSVLGVNPGESVSTFFFHCFTPYSVLLYKGISIFYEIIFFSLSKNNHRNDSWLLISPPHPHRKPPFCELTRDPHLIMKMIRSHFISFPHGFFFLKGMGISWRL